jgi:hypothetical protein
VPNLDLAWDGPPLPGTPIMSIVVTTKAVLPVYAAAMSQVHPDDQAALARELARILHALGDQLAGAVDLAEAVDAAMSGADVDTPTTDGAP